MNVFQVFLSQLMYPNNSLSSYPDFTLYVPQPDAVLTFTSSPEPSKEYQISTTLLNFSFPSLLSLDHDQSHNQLEILCTFKTDGVELEGSHISTFWAPGTLLCVSQNSPPSSGQEPESWKPTRLRNDNLKPTHSNISALTTLISPFIDLGTRFEDNCHYLKPSW